MASAAAAYDCAAVGAGAAAGGVLRHHASSSTLATNAPGGASPVVAQAIATPVHSPNCRTVGINAVAHASRCSYACSTSGVREPGAAGATGRLVAITAVNIAGSFALGALAAVAVCCKVIRAPHFIFP